MLELNKKQNEKIDVVIPYHIKDNEIIELCITGCMHNIHNLGKIYVVTKNTTLGFSGVTFIDDDEFFSNKLSKKYIESRWKSRSPEVPCRSGWLFQQFVKMGCCHAIADITKHYLVVDADVIFLKKIHFLENERMLLAKAREYNQAYFDSYEKLLGEPANREYSFVAHHMLISRDIMLELLQTIEKRFNKVWYDAILDGIEHKKGSILSEYELYGHYLKNHYPEKFIARKLVNVQNFRVKHLLKVLFNQADYVTVHYYKKPQNNPKTSPRNYRFLLKMVRSRLEKQKRRN